MRAALRELWQNPYIRLIGFLLPAVLAYIFLAQTRSVWINFVVAYIIAYLAHPLVAGLEHRRIPRWVGTTLTMIFLFILLAVISLLLGRVITELSIFVEDLPSTIDRANTFIDRMQQFLPVWLREVLQESLTNLQTVFERLVDRAVAWVERSGGDILEGILEVFGGVLRLGVILVLTAYILHGFPTFRQSIMSALPKRHQPFAEELAEKLDRSVGGYVRAQLLIAVIVGFLVWLALFLIGVPLSVPLGFLAAMFNVIPFLGPIIASVPALLLSFTVGWVPALMTAGALLAIQQLDGNFISPRIFARTTQLHPVTIIVAVLAGSSLAGFLGALVSVPSAAFLNLLYREYYQQSAWYRRDS
ncbi:MAG: AI-2E family transporter [Trueperaceae bacterium]|nr:AI-2E family transporter [Trueperaceae bacterium]